MECPNQRQTVGVLGVLSNGCSWYHLRRALEVIRYCYKSSRLNFLHPHDADQRYSLESWEKRPTPNRRRTQGGTPECFAWSNNSTKLRLPPFKLAQQKMMGWLSVELPHRPLITSGDPWNLSFTNIKLLHFVKVTEELSHMNTWRIAQWRDEVIA